MKNIWLHCAALRRRRRRARLLGGLVYETPRRARAHLYVYFAVMPHGIRGLT